MAFAHTAILVIAATGFMLLVYLVLVYNGLVRVRNAVGNAWANIDVLLKQRHDELPRLVEVCKAYKSFEQETLVRVAEARRRVALAREARDVGALGPAEASLRAGVARVFALAEGYPDLKANQQFLQLQGRITALEDAIADRREFYNECATVDNVRIEQVPDVIVARLFRFREARLLDFDGRGEPQIGAGSLFIADADGKAA